MYRDAWQVAVTHGFGPHQLRASYTRGGDARGNAIKPVGGIGLPGPGSSAWQLSLGYGYTLSKRTELWTSFTRLANGSAARYNLAGNPCPNSGRATPRPPSGRASRIGSDAAQRLFHPTGSNKEPLHEQQTASHRPVRARPWAAAQFYQDAFGFRKVGETDSSLARGVYLTDGTISIALLNYKSDHAAGEDRGKDFVGLHHIGVWVEDIVEARKTVEAAGGNYYMGEVPVKGNIFYEVKYRDPNGIIIDLTDHGWGGASRAGGDGEAGPALRNPDLKADRGGL